MIAAVSLWEAFSPDSNIQLFEDGAGNPLILRLETNELTSTLVTATLNIDACTSLTGQIDQQSYLEQSMSQTTNYKKRKPSGDHSRPSKKTPFF